MAAGGDGDWRSRRRRHALSAAAPPAPIMTSLHTPLALAPTGGAPPAARVPPVVLLSICDAYVRRAEGCDRVVGTLLGVVEGGVAVVTAAFTVPHSETADQVGREGDRGRRGRLWRRRLPRDVRSPCRVVPWEGGRRAARAAPRRPRSTADAPSFYLPGRARYRAPQQPARHAQKSVPPGRGCRLVCDEPGGGAARGGGRPDPRVLLARVPPPGEGWGRAGVEGARRAWGDGAGTGKAQHANPFLSLLPPVDPPHDRHLAHRRPRPRHRVRRPVPAPARQAARGLVHGDPCVRRVR